MPTPAILSISALCGAAAALAVTFALRPAGDALPPAPDAEWVRTVARLREQQSELQQQLAALAAPRPESAAAGSVERVAVPQLDPAQVAAAVEAYLRRRAAGAGDGAAGTAEAGFDPERAFGELRGSSYWDNPEAWKRAFASGRMDELIAQFEAAAKASPTDTKAQMQLVSAYLAYNQMDQSKWQLSMKADGVLDKVLELDPVHWQARFTKAVSYTFWPEFLGKKGEAITHFEKLVQQQAAMPVEANQAQTYLYLGNLLEARDPARARAVWAQGAARHPENQELQQKRSGS
jgi:tetratricopeptide (TPR) repeat protein